jgi:hypothetical protein
MNHDNAKLLAIEHLNKTDIRYAAELLIVDESTIETADSWIFFYESRKWIEEGDRTARLLGNLPIEVSKNDGSIHRLSLDRYFELQKILKSRRSSEEQEI